MNRKAISQGATFAPGPLYFATSSPEKLVQARLFLSSLGHRVEQVEYLARPYREPYGESQETLLTHALEQILARTSRPILVFVEDTTVRVEALSSDTDYPGQRAKEWFQETAHEELIRKLDAKGRGMRAVVKSDIALHVPGAPELIFFHGEVGGEILRSAAPARTNPLYPWLESRDFSGWFRPDGAARALGAMSYEESIEFDFRIRALRKLAGRLDEYTAVLSLSPQCVIPIRGADRSVRRPAATAIRDDMMIVVLGRPGAGKTTIGHYLSMRHGFWHMESSTILLAAAASAGCEHSIKASLAQELFDKLGYGAVEEHAVNCGLIPSDQPVVYTGVRTVEGLAALLDHAESKGRACFVVHVDVGKRKAMYRYLDRARTMGNHPPLDYRVIIRRDMEFGALPYARVAADWRLVNSGTQDGLLNRLDRMLASFEAGRARRDRQFRPRLMAALCSVAARRDDNDPERAWLRRRHPSLVAQRELSGRGAALHRVLHSGTKGECGAP